MTGAVQQGQGDVVGRLETESLRSVAAFERKRGHTELARIIESTADELDHLRTLLSSSRGEQGWRTPDDLPELKDGDRFAVYLAFDTGEVKLADWVAWTETASEYHASTGVYLGQSPQDGDALYMTDDGFDVRKDDHGRWVSHKHHDDGTKTPFYVTAWTEALKPLPSAPGSVPTSLAGQVPDGYVIVPKKPTDEMLVAGRAHAVPATQAIAPIYLAMCAAAPQPTAGGDAP